MNAPRTLLDQVSKRARQAEVFDRIESDDSSLRCTVKGVEAQAEYRVTVQGEQGPVWIGLYSPDRWLSESIESELLHTGDKLDDLLEEELIDQGYEARVPVEHFRDDQKLYVFRSRVPLAAGEAVDLPGVIDRTARTLLAYEACFRQLGDMVPQDKQA